MSDKKDRSEEWPQLKVEPANDVQMKLVQRVAFILNDKDILDMVDAIQRAEYRNTPETLKIARDGRVTVAKIFASKEFNDWRSRFVL